MTALWWVIGLQAAAILGLLWWVWLLTQHLVRLIAVITEGANTLHTTPPRVVIRPQKNG